MGRYYKSNFRGSELRCYEDCSIYNECIRGNHVLCLKVYDFMNKRRGPELYFTEVKISLLLSNILLKLLR